MLERRQDDGENLSPERVSSSHAVVNRLGVFLLCPNWVRALSITAQIIVLTSRSPVD